MLKKGGLYYPSKEFQKKAWLNDKKIYKDASKNPIEFWAKSARELLWQEPWKETFLHKPPYLEWFSGGKINITENALDRHLKTRKDKIALIWEPESAKEKPKIFTYQELFKEINKFSNALLKLGVKKGDRVGIYLPVIPELVISMLACARIGAVHSVIFSAFSSAALQARLEDTEAKILITADGYFRRGEVIDLKQNAEQGLKGTKVEKLIVVKRAGNRINWLENRDLWWQEIVKNESDFCQAEKMDSEDLLFILYTSGSTGKPKGCCHTCGGYAVQANFTGKWVFDFKDKDIFWCTSDPGWITGHTYAIYSPLLLGITTLIFEGAPDWPVSDRWAQIIEKHSVTIFYTAPTAIRMFKKYGAEIIKKYKFRKLRILGSVGEPIDESAWLWYFHEVGKARCPIVDTWWQTETGGILISSLPGIGPFKPAFAGLALPGIKFDILDENGKSCRVGQEGNLVILYPYSPGLLRGIYKDPEKYEKTYWSQYGNEIYFTSDRALIDKNGLIRIVGRLDDVIKVAGHRITTGELENAVNKHSEIAECAVIGIPDQIKGEAPVVFVAYQGKTNSEDIKKEVALKIREAIGPIALPKAVYLAEDLPKTRSGKIMRRILKRLFTGEELGDLSTLANPESVEKIRALIFKK
ncbi:MAG: acetyl-CoA synthetase [Parcubacteria group bacterium Licking1014_1]|nr:MAG: acetyl-CoA synthetase [Parcubacteria group bacterium Licking1014_1]